ncbi:MAG: zinc ribbon domain-containing protein [Piscinibacter sp.]|uniref:FmdB family zinc ribbon protein n=1 Tax=Piscinibacter sp. TaxID=1903157 RepID=UPI00258BBECA|nr:FmdB family zinc ribbon protein [Piscinibacter sp.]MCW5666036.1 zinc ribbon domain-containing protein [Piscinibacter sp.]
MPIYAYRCDACGHAKDVLQKISDPVLTTCPACGAGEFRKQLTAAGFQLKGSGWYVTDFKGGNSGGKAAEAKPAEAKPADAKPADSKPTEGGGSASGGDTSASAAAGGCGSSCACH